jgi:hypothetical protein
LAKSDRCPICNVSVKPENLIRHLNDIHPRHPDTPRLREELKTTVGRIARKRSSVPFHVRPWQVALVVLLVSGGVGAYYLTQVPTYSGPFPCVVGTQYVYHWHTQLIVHSGDVPVTIPVNIGIVGTCLEPVHTHNTDGVIHVETTVNRLYSIGDFYRVWGKPFGNPTQMIVNTTTITPNPDTILYDSETLHIYYASFT